MRIRALVLAGALLCVSVQACGPIACTKMGGTNGVRLEIPKALFVASGDVRFTVCSDTDCASATAVLYSFPDDPTSPQQRGAGVTFADLARTFAPGEVKVTVELRGSQGQLVAERTETIRLKRYYPNGKECDGDGYVSGGLSLRPSDRV